MIDVVWTRAALGDLQGILDYAHERSPQGAATISRQVEVALRAIATFPRAARRDAETEAYEAVVRGVPILLIYDLVGTDDGALRVEMVAVFHTSRDPNDKPGRRSE